MTAIISRRTFNTFVGALMLAFAFAQPAAAAAGGPAADFVQRMGDKALGSLTAKELGTKERETRVRSLLNSSFDVQTIGKFAMGTYWKEATGAQKSEYMRLFEDMIVKTYAQRFSEYSGQSFKVSDSVKASEKDTVVNSEIVQKDGPPVAVQWRVRNSGGSMKIIDVIVEGVSMSVTQRSDFAAVIQGGGGKVDVLIKSLKERAAPKKK